MRIVEVQELGRGPVKLFVLPVIDCRLGQPLAIKDGMVPLSWLLLKASEAIDVKVLHEVGMVPVKLFEKKYNTCIAVPLNVGSDPLN